MSLRSPEETAKRQREGRIAATHAMAVLKIGDRIRVTRCPGNKRWVVFAGWSGQWIVSKSGIEDIHPLNVDRLNDGPVNFLTMEAP